MNSLPLLLAQRARLLVVLAGLAWLLGLMPSTPVRLLVVGLVAVGTVLDVVSDHATAPAAVRVTTLRGRGR